MPQDEVVHVNSSIEADEDEEVGVEQNIRDIWEEASGSITAKVKRDQGVHRGLQIVCML